MVTYCATKMTTTCLTVIGNLCKYAIVTSVDKLNGSIDGRKVQKNVTSKLPLCTCVHQFIQSSYSLTVSVILKYSLELN